jgi:nuclear pore complex protein Nup210
MTCRALDQDTSLNEWWLAAKQTTPKPMRKGLASTTLLIAWMLWKQRDACVFEGESPSTAQLSSQIRKEAAMWAEAGANGLRVILPSTWDVH